jgi:hypothetical protein
MTVVRKSSLTCYFMVIIKKLLELDAWDLVRSKWYLPTVYETLFVESAYTDMMTARSCDVINYVFNLYRALHKQQVSLINNDDNNNNYCYCCWCHYYYYSLLWLVGQDLLTVEASRRSHSDAPHSVEFLCTSDQSDAEVHALDSAATGISTASAAAAAATTITTSTAAATTTTTTTALLLLIHSFLYLTTGP